MGFLFDPAQNCEIFYPISISLVVIMVFIYLAKRRFTGSPMSRLGFVLIVSGGILNILERVYTGCVRDYVNFFGLFRFNLFDLLVTSGAFLLIYELWKTKK
jgi:lipoprotein signal peptidase